MNGKIVCYTGNSIKENDSRTRIVTIYGTRITNHAIFLARMLHKIGKCVLVVDNSGEGILKECIAVILEDEEIIQYRGVAFTINRAYDDRMFRQYDVVLVLSGFHRDIRIEEQSNQVYVFTDFQKQSVKRIVELAKRIAIPYAIVYMDCVDCSFAQPNYIEFGFQDAVNMIQKRYFLPLSEQDYVCSLMMQYAGRFNLQDFSPKYQEMLYEMVHSLFPEYTVTTLKRQYVM